MNLASIHTLMQMAQLSMEACLRLVFCLFFRLVKAGTLESKCKDLSQNIHKLNWPIVAPTKVSCHFLHTVGQRCCTLGQTWRGHRRDNPRRKLHRIGSGRLGSMETNLGKKFWQQEDLPNPIHVAGSESTPHLDKTADRGSSQERIWNGSKVLKF